MTASDSTTLPDKDVRFCPETLDYEVIVVGQRIGSAPTMMQGYELANEYIYQQLTREHLDPADLVQDDAEAIFFMLHHMSVSDMDPLPVGDEATDVDPWTESAVNRMVFKMTDADHTAFWSQVQKTDGCWHWQGGMTPQWYGYYKGQLAHRVAYVLTHGPIPAGLMICHHCDHPPVHPT